MCDYGAHMGMLYLGLFKITFICILISTGAFIYAINNYQVPVIGNTLC